MKRFGITSLEVTQLLFGAVILGPVPATGVSADTLRQTSYFCQTHPNARERLDITDISPVLPPFAEALAAAKAALAAQLAANACRPTTSAHCHALAAAADALAAKARRLEMVAIAFAKAARQPVPTFPSIDFGGTAPIAGLMPVVASVGETTGKTGKQHRITSLPATGGAVRPLP